MNSSQIRTSALALGGGLILGIGVALLVWGDPAARAAAPRPIEPAAQEPTQQPHDGELLARLEAIEARLDALETVRRPAHDWPPLDPDLEELSKRIQTHGTDPFGEVLSSDAPDPNLVTRALAAGDLAELRRLLDARADPNARDDDRTTPLAAAAIAGQLEALELLFAAGAELEGSSGRRKMTPLLAALDATQEAAALRLLELGADARAADKNGENALIWASWNGCDKVVQRLMASGARIDFQSHDGGTALQNAAVKGRTEIVRQLLLAGADPNLSNRAGDTALSHAQAAGHAETAALISSYGAQ